MILDHDANLQMAEGVNRPKLVWTNPAPTRMIRANRPRVRKPILILFITVALIGSGVKAHAAVDLTLQRGVDTASRV